MHFIFSRRVINYVIWNLCSVDTNSKIGNFSYISVFSFFLFNFLPWKKTNVYKCKYKESHVPIIQLQQVLTLGQSWFIYTPQLYPIMLKQILDISFYSWMYQYESLEKRTS